MKCKIHFYLLNDHFSVEHAEANYEGKESELNRRYEWQDEMDITNDVLKAEIHEKATYPIQGTMPDGNAFTHEISNMRLIELSSEGGATYVGCSESILDSVDIDESNDTITVKVYLKDYEPLANPIPGIYIAAQEFPKELIQ
jgi:hypothetical protein